jgi:hypothetical protein
MRKKLRRSNESRMVRAESIGVNSVLLWYLSSSSCKWTNLPSRFAEVSLYGVDHTTVELIIVIESKCNLKLHDE